MIINSPMMDQDDLLLLWHLRDHAASNDGAGDRSSEKLAQNPGRAAGQVMNWALSRTAAHLTRFARRGWRFEMGMVPSAQEKRLLETVRALAEGDDAAAREAATWLVPKGEVSALLGRAAPLVSFYPSYREAGRRAARA
ncbi:hypothetical protein [Parvularcula maris]|uniref:Uncharacterized protein n=1 Tax=Parvularcula maris TaxID=2965077 RepID=A0A9X2RJR1_9PROT|nr:hypothetical protein [Parvularcula maris]MCQ8186151.1 hypothetical protein [Parvularcula maris]